MIYGGLFARSRGMIFQAGPSPLHSRLIPCRILTFSPRARFPPPPILLFLRAETPNSPLHGNVALLLTCSCSICLQLLFGLVIAGGARPGRIDFFFPLLRRVPSVLAFPAEVIFATNARLLSGPVPMWIEPPFLPFPKIHLEMFLVFRFDPMPFSTTYPGSGSPGVSF